MMEPRNQISTKALKVWRISGLLFSLIFWAITLTMIIITKIFEWPYWISLVTSGVSLVVTYLSVYLLPLLRWKRWRYEVRDTEIEIQSGIFIIKRTLIPMMRVQHVETNQGPLLRKYQLASVEISTAATTHEIPALELSEADDLRFYISKMASVEEEDV
jgi:membrane protein YdbS with pleckstrin-like domain